MKNGKNQLLMIIGIGVLVFAASFAGILLTRNVGKSSKAVNTEASRYRKIYEKNRPLAGSAGEISCRADGYQCG